jgi:exosortase H (IPTLxxWG-CTERM-specific)
MKATATIGGRSEKPRPKAWVGSKRPIFTFVVLFAVLLGLFSACAFIPLLEKKVLPGLQVLNAEASVAIMRLFGEKASANHTTIASPRYSVNIAHGCDAIEPAGLFIAAVLAFPASLRSKLPGLVIGTSLLLLMNLVRIISLFYTGVYWPRAFETMHVDVWQPAFILLSLLFWVVWAWWATKPKAQPIDAA